jgi:hypothetical protein
VSEGSRWDCESFNFDVLTKMKGETMQKGKYRFQWFVASSHTEKGLGCSINIKILAAPEAALCIHMNRGVLTTTGGDSSSATRTGTEKTQQGLPDLLD